MKNYLYLAGTLFIISGALIFAPTAVKAKPTYIVTKTADTAGKCTKKDCGLREAIIAANESNKAKINIKVPAGKYILTRSGSGETEALTGDLNITNTTSVIKIIGAGAKKTTINGNSSDRIFTIAENSKVRLRGLSLKKGQAVTGENGGAILNYGNLRLIKTKVSNNTASNQGGGIYMASGKLRIANSKIVKNTTTAQGGAGLFIADGAVTVINSKINRNVSIQHGGGFTTAGGTVTVTKSTIAYNEATNGFGGGIFNYGNVILDQVSLHHNTSGNNGAGISTVASGQLGMINTTVAHNISESNGGGLVFGTNVTAEIAHSTIAYNEAAAGETLTGEAAGIYNRATTGTITLRGSIIANNTLASDQSASDCGGDATAAITSVGYNIIATYDTTCADVLTADSTDQTNIDPSFSSAGLTNNGGATKTIAVESTSEAIDLVPLSACLTLADEPLFLDQRNFARPEGPTCDSGALEFGSTE